MDFDVSIFETIGNVIKTIFAVLFGIIAIGGGAFLHFTVFGKKNQDKYSGFMGWLYEYFNFEKLMIEPLLKLTYIIAAIHITLSALLELTSFDGIIDCFTQLIFGNIALRVVYELILLLVSMARNLNELNGKTAGDASDTNYRFCDSVIPTGYKTTIPKVEKPAAAAPATPVAEPVAAPVPAPVPMPVPTPVEPVAEEVAPVPMPVPTPVEPVAEEVAPAPVPMPVPTPVEPVAEEVAPAPIPVPVPVPVEPVAEEVAPAPVPMPVPTPVEPVAEEAAPAPIPMPVPTPVEPVAEEVAPAPVPMPVPVPVEPVAEEVAPAPIPMPVPTPVEPVAEEVAPTEPADAPILEKPSCISCGKSIKAGAKFCPYCGTSQQQ